MPSDNSTYAASDPRAALSTARAGNNGQAGEGGFAPSSYALFGEQPPQVDDENGRTWIARAQNFIVAYTEAKPGARLERRGQVDEYVLLIEAREPKAVITANGERQEVPGAHIAMIPPGDSVIELPQGGPVVRVFSAMSADLAAMAGNAAQFGETGPFIPPFKPWPEPSDGWRIRSYSLDVPPREGRFGRIWRCTTLMINVFEPAGPRDPAKLSPHHHDDFEQGSLALGGSYMHHLRWPWTTNANHWRDDEHALCPAPSLAIIPPRSIHTSASVAPGETNLLVDIFGPPRRDFSEMPGWVLNADDYPMPDA